MKKNKFLTVTRREKRWITAKALVVLIILNYFFYRKAGTVLLLIPFGFLFYKWQKNELIHHKQEELKQQFKELLLYASGGMKAGYSAENAFLNSINDMKLLYGEGSEICRILIRLKNGFNNHIGMSKLWKTIGLEYEIVEITEFAEIFEIALSSGGSMTHIMERTAFIIAERMEADKEIETLLCAKKLEQKIMNIMPFALMLYMDVTSHGYFDVMYSSGFGFSIMTVCLFIYMTAFCLSVRITNIQIR